MGHPAITLTQQPHIDAGRMVIVGGVAAGVIAGVHIYQMNGWWKDNRGPFHFEEDLRYALSVDKVGHFYGALAGQYLAEKSLLWAGCTQEQALWWGAGASLGFETYIEVLDGFSRGWGFDRVDFAADVGGALYPVGQHYWPFLRHFTWKMSYRPSPNLNAPGFVPGQKHLLMDDYEGQTYWLSTSVHSLLPDHLQGLWPEWLCIAAGYGARDITGPNPYSVWFIGPDLDMTKIIPQDSPFLVTLAEVLNFIRLPLPALRISPTIALHGVYF